MGSVAFSRLVNRRGVRHVEWCYRAGVRGDASRFAFRVEAGGGFGSGHLIRSLALADELAAPAAVTFILSPSSSGADLVRRRGFSVVVIGEVAGERAVQDTVAALRAASIATLVTDFNGIEPAYLAALRAALPRLRIVCLDDKSVPPELPDVLVRPHAVEAWWPAPSERALIGPRYWILRRDFDALIAGGPAPVRSRVERLLVMLGGATPGRVLAALLGALGELQPDLAMDVVCGPLGDRLEEVQGGVRALGGRAELHVDPPRLPALMSRADLAVVAAGYTLYELAALGVPTIGVALVDHQRETLSALARHGVVHPVWSDASHDFRGVPGAVATLAGDAGQREAMAAAGRRLVDGRGRARVAACVLGHALPGAHAQEAP